MFRQDTAEMAPCWLHLVALFLHIFIIVHVKAVDQWPLTTLEDLALASLVLINRPVHMQARFLTVRAYWPAFQLRRPAYWPTFWLCAPLTDFKSGRPVYSSVDRLTNGSKVNNQGCNVYVQTTPNYCHQHLCSVYACAGKLSWLPFCRLFFQRDLNSALSNF